MLLSSCLPLWLCGLLWVYPMAQWDGDGLDSGVLGGMRVPVWDGLLG